MSGPIVRSGPTKQFTEQWDSVFGDKKAKNNTTTTKTAKKKATKKKK